MHTDHNRPHEGHDAGRDIADSSTPGDQFNPENPGYETTDVNVRGISVFLAGLFGSLFVFFVLCWAMGRAMNSLWEKQDGKIDKWHLAGNDVPPANGYRNLTSNAEMQQEQLNQVTKNFPAPRLAEDDSAHELADLHAREDLMLEHYSRSSAGPQGATTETVYRIPIERAMELIAQRGLPVVQPEAGAAANQVAYSATEPVKEPLTKGFARTAVELEMIASREQRMSYGDAEHTELRQDQPQKK